MLWVGLPGPHTRSSDESESYGWEIHRVSRAIISYVKRF